MTTNTDNDFRTKAAEYETRVKSFDRAKLMEFWEEIKNGKTINWPDGKALEYLIIRAFDLEGVDRERVDRTDVRVEGVRVEWPYSVRWPYRQSEKSNGTVEIEQIDGAVYVDHIACLIECKDKEDTDVAPIYKLRGQLLRRPATTIGAIFTTGEYKEVAVLLSTFMFPQTILLWDAEEIEACLERGNFAKGLRLKFEKAVSHGTTDYNIRDMDKGQNL